LINKKISYIRRILQDIKLYLSNINKVLYIQNKFGCSISSNVCITGNRKSVVIGKNTRINSHTQIRNLEGEVLIGESVLIGQFVSIIAHSYNLNNKNIGKNNMYSSNVTIGDNSWIGAYTMILPGVKIGENCVVGAFSLVNKDIPDNEIWFGIPATKKNHE
jgi:acetyltransferase-like isoleucine patch superfamily enzyme